MITIETIPNECKTDHLFLLVGANPLPNYVAALLLRKANTTFHLLHTQQTSIIAENLRDRILNQHEEHRFALIQIDASDGEAIRSRIAGLLSNILPRASIGLNYTGGTKVMSVHAYLAMEQARPNTVFTYLDAQTLSLRIDGRSGEPVRSVSVSKSCDVDLETLMQLHGYERFQSEILRNLHQLTRAKLVRTIAELMIDPSTYEQWKEYTLQKPLERLPDLGQWPRLAPFVNSVQLICGASADTSQLSMFLGLGSKHSACRSWLQGGWLEEYTFEAIDSARKICELNDLGMNLKPVKRGKDASFELDVAAMRGYQLFVASCIVSTDKHKCEHHFFQVYTRARQLGGDELRSALICLYAKPKQLQEQIDDSWLTEGRIRVFGREHLPDLDHHIRNWISTANQ